MVISSGFVLFKVLFGVIGSLVFVWLLFVATLEAHHHHEAITKTTSSSSSSSKDAANLVKHDKKVVELGKEKLIYDPQLDLNYMMSKRKVPNGPDPIHNRRAGNSKRPPGRT